MKNFVLTSESVTAGHPDKLCDQISDAVIDACLEADPPIGCVAECALASGVAFLSVRHGRPLPFDPAAIARRVLAEEGYGEGAQEQRTTVMLDSAEVPDVQGPIAAEDAVAAQITTAFGYACSQTDVGMPLPIWAAHGLTERMEIVRRDGVLPWLAPDGHAQVAVRFESRHPVAVPGLVLGVFTDGDAPGADAIEEALRREVIEPVFADAALRPGEDTRLVVHHTIGGGGPAVHAGLTGRKTADDTYGGFCRASGSALSGKDPSRVDRIAAYAARHAAVSVVAAGLAGECEVQLSYVPGDREPASVEIDCFGSSRQSNGDVLQVLRAGYDFRVGAIIERFGLWQLPRQRGGRFYRDLARRGHFGRAELELPWDVPADLG